MILEILVASFLGGLILNILPCVLPVLPIKLLSFVHQAQESLGKRAALAGLYSLGIFASFVALGVICAGALVFGHYLGFGFQLDSAWVNGALALIVGALGLKLTGILGWIGNKVRSFNGGALKQFYPISARITSFFSPYIEKIKKKGPYLKAFGEGCLTTALGSACTGPFLAAAMGMAVMLSPWAILMAFAAAGLGMSLPYVPLSFLPFKKIAPKLKALTPWIEKTSGGLMLLVALWFGYLAL